MATDPDQEQIEGQEPEAERWSTILQEVDEASRADRPWYVRQGVSLAWAIGIAMATAIVTVLLLLIVDLFSRGRLFSGRSVSDWLFWSSALLLFAGLVAPSAQDIKGATGGGRTGDAQGSSAARRTHTVRETREEGPQSIEDRQSRAMRKRLLRVYNPWRWRLWMSAGFGFGISVLIGLLAQGAG